MKEAREKSTMASCSRRFLTFVERDTAVDAVDLEFRNKLTLAIAACIQISSAADINSQSLPRSRSSSSSLP